MAAAAVHAPCCSCSQEQWNAPTCGCAGAELLRHISTNRCAHFVAQGASFPLVQQLLAQQAQQAQQAAASVDPAAAQAAAQHLLSGAAESFVAGLRPLAPVAAAEARLQRAQQLLDDLVEESLQVRIGQGSW